MYNVYNIVILFFVVFIVVLLEEMFFFGLGKLLYFYFLRCG